MNSKLFYDNTPFACTLEDGIVGTVMTIQTFGDYARWHPHIHAIVADGFFRRNGVFYVMPRASLKGLAEFFRARLLKLGEGKGDRRALCRHADEVDPYFRL